MTRDEFDALMRSIRQAQKQQAEHKPEGRTSVILSEQQMLIAMQIALARQQDNWNQGRRSTRGLNDEGNWPMQLSLHIQGAVGEVAFAAMHGANAEVGVIGSACDVGRVEVKSVLNHHHSMIVRQGTPADQACALVFIAPPRASLLGWAIAGDVMRDEFVKDVGRGSQWFVPPTALHAGPVPYHLIWGKK